MGSLSTKQFSVKDLQGLSLWLKADAGVTLSGLNVTAWADQSTNAYSFTPLDQNSPNITTIGGKTFIEFTKTNNQGLSNSSILINSPFTFFSVTKMKPTNGGRIFSTYNILNSNVLIGSWSSSNDDGTAYSNRFFGGFEWLAEGTQQNTNVLLTTASVDADLNSVFKQNGGSETTATASNVVSIDGISIGGGYTIFGESSEQSNSFVAEFIIYNRALTTPELQQVEAYLNAKYAIYSPIKNNKISIKKQNLGGGKINLNTYIANDPDARNYISAVEAADGSPLEASVKKAIDNFIIGCKSDGNWTAIKASCLLAGAKTLNGALVPLVGTAPTNFNFITADYDRKTGLLGDGSNKYLSSNRNNNADPQQSKHLSAYFTSSNSRDFTRVVMGTQTSIGGSFITTNVSSVSFRINYGGAPAGLSNSSSITGFVSVSRSDGLSQIYRALGNSTTVITSAMSTTPLNAIINVFSNSSLTSYSNGRIAFYSIGESIDLQKLDNRVTDYINAISSI